MEQPGILKRLFPDKVITISAVDGSRTIPNSGDIFKTWIDPGFEKWDLNKLDQKTPEIKIQMYKMLQDANFKQVFCSLNDDLDKLCLTQHQITKFCVDNQKYYRENGRRLFFLFKVGGKYFVAYVFVTSDGLDVVVYRLIHNRVWSAGSIRRLVVPQ